MIQHHQLDTANAIVYSRPKTSLEQADFVELGRTVDPYIEETGDLAGLITDAPRFPGWEGLGAMTAHCSPARGRYPARHGRSG